MHDYVLDAEADLAWGVRPKDVSCRGVDSFASPEPKVTT